MNTIEQLEWAVFELATGSEGIHARLAKAYKHHLCFIVASELPAELAPQFKSILARLGDGSKIAKLGTIKARRIAMDIHRLSCELSQGLYH